MFTGGVVFAQENISQTTSPNAPLSQTSSFDVAKDVSESVSENIPETIPEKNFENLKKFRDFAFNSNLFSIVIVILLLGVLAFCFLGVLKLYRKISNKGYIVEAPPKETLASPKDFKSAINLFLGKNDE